MNINRYKSVCISEGKTHILNLSLVCHTKVAHFLGLSNTVFSRDWDTFHSGLRESRSKHSAHEKAIAHRNMATWQRLLKSPRWRDRVFRPQSNIYIHADDHALGIWCVLCIQNMSFSTPPRTLTWKYFLKSITDTCKWVFGNMRWLLYSRVRNQPKSSCGNMYHSLCRCVVCRNK